MSENAQGPSAMGIGKWGRERADNHFFNEIDLTRYKTAAEIGCGDGYLLRCLREAGFTRLFGIEPSVNAKKNRDGITYINDFVDEKLRLEEKVDLILSIAVFEHVENINGILAFCHNNLKDAGELFFVVPNAQKQLESGDPALFIHQHVHYFTEDSLKYLLSKNGFQINSLASREEGFHVRAGISAAAPEKPAEIIPYNSYQEKLAGMLNNLLCNLAGENILVHGACNALNNITGWIAGDFQLADNDENKQGKKYFNRVVHSPADVNVNRFETIIIIPQAYYRQIKAEYLKRGFAGNIVGTDAAYC
jgi:SAM-dependent methyltransferase